MENINLSSDEIEELKNIIIWAIDEGYNTNKITRDLIYKLKVSKDILKNLDEYSNAGLNLAQ